MCTSGREKGSSRNKPDRARRDLQQANVGSKTRSAGWVPTSAFSFDTVSSIAMPLQGESQREVAP